jgi:uncharacterized protein (TIGR02001 family)
MHRFQYRELGAAATKKRGAKARGGSGATMRANLYAGGLAAIAAVSFAGGAAGKPLGYLFPSVTAASEYRFDGYSNSGREPAFQTSLYLWRPDNFYAGIFTSTVKMNAPGTPSWEIDYYLGKTFETKTTRYTLEAMYTAFPDDDIYGPTLDFWQIKAAAKRKIDDRLTLGLTGAYVPEGSYRSGVAIKLVGDGSYKLTPWLSLNGAIGKRWIERGYDRTFWDGGVALSWKALVLDIRYVDTDLTPAECFFSDACESAVVSKLTFNVPITYGAD